MCAAIQIRGGPRIDRLGDLWSLVGRENVAMTHRADFTSDDCLCHVDVEVTAFNGGYKSASGWDKYGADYVWFDAGQTHD